jgi:hypothetical protein
MRQKIKMLARPLLIALLLQLSAYAVPQEGPPAPGGLTCVGVWPNKILVMDENDHRVVSVIELQSGVPEWLFASYDKRRMVAITDHRNVEVIDLTTRKVMGHFPLVDEGRRPFVVNAAMGPRGRYFYVVLKSAIREVDRFTLEDARFYIIDIEQRKVAKVFDFPKEFEGGFGFGDSGYKISEDEKLLYVFRDDILIFDLESFKQVDKIELSKPLHAGMFPISFAGEPDPNEDPGFVTSLFSATDPYSRRAVAGVVRVNLRTKQIELFPLGPTIRSRGRLYTSADRNRVYAVLVNNSQDPNRRPELYAFDLLTRRMIARAEFENRSRFTFMASGDKKKLYLYGPGPVMEIYNADTLKLERTLTLEGDITEVVVLRP